MSNVQPTPDDQQFEQLESNFPLLSGVAFSNAYDQAVHAGLSVVVSDGEAIFEVFPDGHRKKVKTITPPSPAEPGQKFTMP